MPTSSPSTAPMGSSIRLPVPAGAAGSDAAVTSVACSGSWAWPVLELDAMLR